MGATRIDSSGFTLIELLVAVAIIALLAALILPAVQTVRESARRTQCKNNIKQLVLAMQTYESAQQVYPLSYGKGPFTGDNTGASWMQMILPGIEQGNLCANLRFGRPLSDPQNTAVAQTVVPAFLCPSDDSNGLMGFRANVPGIWAVNNYKACAGSNWNWGPFSPLVSTAGRNANTPDGLDHGNGIIWRGYTGVGGGLIAGPGGPPPATRAAQIRDGSSHTFAVGEAVPEWCRHTWWYWFNATTATCAIPLNYRRLPDLQVTGEGDWPENYSFLSRHSGGGQFGMADGSVRFVSDSIDFKVYRALGTISGGEPVGGF
jgi:prepilin-type N-terminal cleavage/methylation domain-containing protein/prepilin-type processing-associated H-X9-DG protein